MKKELYKVKFVNQQTGEDWEHYVIAKNIMQVVSEYADILSIEFLSVEDLTSDEL